jgi:hypothetical protein
LSLLPEAAPRLAAVSWGPIDAGGRHTLFLKTLLATDCEGWLLQGICRDILLEVSVKKPLCLKWQTLARGRRQEFAEKCFSGPACATNLVWPDRGATWSRLPGRSRARTRLARAAWRTSAARRPSPTSAGCRATWRQAAR